MIYTPTEQNKIRNSPDYKKLVDGYQARFEATTGNWPNLLPTRGADTIYAAAAVANRDPDWKLPAVFHHCVDDVVAKWRTYEEKDTTKTTMPLVAESIYLLPEHDQRLDSILTDWLKLNQRGLSPGPGLYARAMAWHAVRFGPEEDLIDQILFGYAGNPGLIEIIRAIRKCGIPPFGTPFYWIAVDYGFILWLWHRFKAHIRKAVSAEDYADLSQRMSAFTALPWNLMLGNVHPLVGDDWKGDDGKIKPARLYVGQPWYYSFNKSAASNWFAFKAGQPSRLRDLLATPKDGPAPRQANADWIALDDDGSVLLRKSKLGLLRWEKTYFNGFFTAGHNPKDKHGFPWWNPV